MVLLLRSAATAGATLEAKQAAGRSNENPAGKGAVNQGRHGRVGLERLSKSVARLVRCSHVARSNYSQQTYKHDVGYVQCGCFLQRISRGDQDSGNTPGLFVRVWDPKQAQLKLASEYGAHHGTMEQECNTVYVVWT